MEPPVADRAPAWPQGCTGLDWKRPRTHPQGPGQRDVAPM